GELVVDRVRMARALATLVLFAVRQARAVEVRVRATSDGSYVNIEVEVPRRGRSFPLAPGGEPPRRGRAPRSGPRPVTIALHHRAAQGNAVRHRIEQR